MTEHGVLHTTPSPVKLRIDDYLLLDEAGAFDGHTKTELLGRELLYKNAQHRPHAYLRSELAYRLRRALERLGSNLYVMTEASVTISPHSAPEPDIDLTDEPEGSGLIPAASVSLIVEVADTTLESDLMRKAAIYCGANVPGYWVADVAGRIVHRFWSPTQEGYASRDQVPSGSSLAAVTLPGLSIDGIAAWPTRLPKRGGCPVRPFAVIIRAPDLACGKGGQYRSRRGEGAGIDLRFRKPQLRSHDGPGALEIGRFDRDQERSARAPVFDRERSQQVGIGGDHGAAIYAEGRTRAWDQ